MDSTSNHLFYAVEKQVKKICQPLFSHTPFEYFDYERYYYDGFFIQPGLIPEFGYEAFKKKLLPSLEELHLNNAHYIYLSPSLMLPEAAVQPTKFMENIKMGDDFEVYHRLCLLFKKSQYVEAFAFGLNKKSGNVVEIFMNYANILEKFCIYFRETAKYLIEQSLKQELNLTKL